MNGTMRAGIEARSPNEASTYALAVMIPARRTKPSSTLRRARESVLSNGGCSACGCCCIDDGYTDKG